MKRNDEDAFEAKKQYVSEQASKRQLPHFIQLYLRAAANKSKKLPLTDYELDQSVVRYYAAVSKQVIATVVLTLHLPLLFVFLRFFVFFCFLLFFRFGSYLKSTCQMQKSTLIRCVWECSTK